MFFPGAQVVTVQYGACERIDSGFDSWVHNLNGLFLFVSSSLFLVRHIYYVSGHGSC